MAPVSPDLTNSDANSELTDFKIYILYFPKTVSDLFSTILIVNNFDHEPAINNDVKTMTSKRKRTNFCVNKRRGDDWRHATLGSGCLRTQRRGYVQTDDNENLLCSVIVCNPLPSPHLTRPVWPCHRRAEPQHCWLLATAAI